MKVFISWSGEKSKAVALALRQWIHDVIQNAEPWMSHTDIDAGARWGRDMDEKLSDTKFGVICLTRGNLGAPWILFEAGALAKSINDTFVCPYLIDLSPSDIPQGPLAQFQAKQANQKETWELICTMNKALREQGGEGLTDEQLRRTFEKWWPDLDKTLKSLPEEQTGVQAHRPVEEMVSDVLEILRGLARGDQANTRRASRPTKEGLPLPELIKEAMLRHGGKCVYCESTSDLKISHIVPIFQGGTHQPDNLQVICAVCYVSKYGETHGMNGDCASQPLNIPLVLTQPTH